MIPRIVEVNPLDGCRLWLRFQDGRVGTIEVVKELWGPMFEPLKNPDLFFQASVNPELETVTWPNGADLASEILYQAAKHGLYRWPCCTTSPAPSARSTST